MPTPFALFALLALPVAAGDDARQVHWQRTLEDARRQSAVDGRPILVVINADGESASERIVVERYRQPEWVELTRSFHCVVGSYFRHTPRDFDASGRRIECPRLGEVTCGEHIALEPVLHERYLLGEHIVVDDGVVQRISPRHALVLPDGTKAWDLFLLFDFAQLDQRLQEARDRWPGPVSTDWTPESSSPFHRARVEREELAAQAPNLDTWLFEVTRRPSIERGVDGELRRVLDRLDTSRGVVRGALFDLGAATGRGSQIAWALRERAIDPQVLDPRAAALAVPGIVELGWDDVSQRAFSLSHAVLGDAEAAAAARAAVARRTPLGALPEPFDVLVRVGERARSGVEPIAVAKAKPELPPGDELERGLESADEALARDRANPELQLALGRAALLLARRRMQDGGAGIGLLLEDAKLALAKAQEARPDDVLLLLDRARVANYLSDFEEQERLALAALRARGADLLAGGLDDDMTEAARWLGDASARLLSRRSSADATVAALGMHRGALALTEAAFGPEHDATDWLSLASFYGALGRARERIELAYAGLLQFPLDNALRSELASACWSVGRPELLVERSDRLARLYADRGWAELDWYAGHARVLEAEWQRRGGYSDLAIETYGRAEESFLRASVPAYAETCAHYLGMCALGRGFAHLTALRREEAARCVVEAARVRPEVATVRDGLEREVVDLIDAVLEWRTSGASPVDALAWLGDLLAVDPANPFWPSAVSDSELREALRAFGRGAPDEGYRYLGASVAAARLALELDPGDTSRRALAQVETIWAEQLLARYREEDRTGIEGWLAHASELLGVERLPADAPRAELEARAALLRAQLGRARPVFRPGR